MQKPIEQTELGNTDYLEEHQVASNYGAENASHFRCNKDRIQVLVKSRWRYLLDFGWTSCKSQLRSLKSFDRGGVVLLHLPYYVQKIWRYCKRIGPVDWWQGFYTCLGGYEQFSIWSWGGVKSSFTYS